MIPVKIVDFTAVYHTALCSFMNKILFELNKQLLTDIRKYEDIENIPGIYQTHNGMFKILLCEKEVTGSIGIRNLGDRVGEIKRFFVDKDHRGYGYGKKLLEAAINHARKYKFKKLKLDTTSKSPVAIDIFKRYGFYYTERYNDNPDAEFFMEKLLT